MAIDGGTGYNTLLVIGTEAADTFVITKDGVLGAGLNVSYTNIEKIEVDGQGGNDTFDVLSTDPEAITILEGGSGSNTFNVGGDVTTPVVALNSNGTSGIINHSVSSADPQYNGIFASGVPCAGLQRDGGPGHHRSAGRRRHGGAERGLRQRVATGLVRDLLHRLARPGPAE